MFVGGELSIVYTLKEYRQQNLMLIQRNALIQKCLARGDYLTVHTNFSGFNSVIGYDFIGRSRIICIH